MSSKVKALTLWQPWATFITQGKKKYETRSWNTNYRGELLICSGKNVTEALAFYPAYIVHPEDYPLGQAIALCELTDCMRMTRELIDQQTVEEIKSGYWEIGRYAWKLENIRPVTPFPVRGKPGLFSIELDREIEL